MIPEFLRPLLLNEADGYSHEIAGGLDGTLPNGAYVHWDKGSTTITLDGEFSLDELQKITGTLRPHQPPDVITGTVTNTVPPLRRFTLPD